MGTPEDVAAEKFFTPPEDNTALVEHAHVWPECYGGGGFFHKHKRGAVPHGHNGAKYAGTEAQRRVGV